MNCWVLLARRHAAVPVITMRVALWLAATAMCDSMVSTVRAMASALSVPSCCKVSPRRVVAMTRATSTPLLSCTSKLVELVPTSMIAIVIVVLLALRHVHQVAWPPIHPRHLLHLQANERGAHAGTSRHDAFRPHRHWDDDPCVT